jgi:hypothetical protein
MRLRIGTSRSPTDASDRRAAPRPLQVAVAYPTATATNIAARKMLPRAKARGLSTTGCTKCGCSVADAHVLNVGPTPAVYDLAAFDMAGRGIDTVWSRVRAISSGSERAERQAADETSANAKPATSTTVMTIAGAGVVSPAVVLITVAIAGTRFSGTGGDYRRAGESCNRKRGRDRLTDRHLRPSFRVLGPDPSRCKGRHSSFRAEQLSRRWVTD